MGDGCGGGFGVDCGSGCVWEGSVQTALPKPDTPYVESLLLFCYLLRVRKSRLARVGNTADSRGNRKPPR